MTERQLNEIIEKHKANCKASRNENPGGDFPGNAYHLSHLFSLLQRGYLGLESITPGRTAIYAETAAGQLKTALSELDNGRAEAATVLIEQVANSLLALHELDWKMAEDSEK